MGNDIAFNKYHCPFVIASKFRVFLPISALRSQAKKRSRNPTQVVTDRLRRVKIAQLQIPIGRKRNNRGGEMDRLAFMQHNLDYSLEFGSIRFPLNFVEISLCCEHGLN